MRDVSQKLRRLLYIVPYVAKHPEGVPVEQLAKMLGAERDELLADLDLLSQVGPPDGDPGEYLLVSVDEGRTFSARQHAATPDGWWGRSPVLLSGTDGRRQEQIVLAYQRYGRGKAIALPVQDTWQWQMDPKTPITDPTHAMFWRRLIRWLVDGVPEQVNVSTTADRVEPGEAVKL